MLRGGVFSKANGWIGLIGFTFLMICLNLNHANFHIGIGHWLALRVSDLEMDLILTNSNRLLKNNRRLVAAYGLSRLFCSAVCQSRYGSRHQQQKHNC